MGDFTNLHSYLCIYDYVYIIINTQIHVNLDIFHDLHIYYIYKFTYFTYLLYLYIYIFYMLF